MAGGGLVGFVFGIPRLLQDASPAPQAPDGTGANARPTDGAAPYGGNTSLEQISDWLTKILVGVGLTQLANIPDGLNSLGEFLAPGLGNLPGAEVFSIGLVVFAVLDRLLPDLHVDAAEPPVALRRVGHPRQAPGRRAARRPTRRGERDQGEHRGRQGPSGAGIPPGTGAAHGTLGRRPPLEQQPRDGSDGVPSSGSRSRPGSRRRKPSRSSTPTPASTRS